MIRRPPRSTLDRSSAASDVYKRQTVAQTQQDLQKAVAGLGNVPALQKQTSDLLAAIRQLLKDIDLSLIHISEPTRPY